LHIVIPFNMQPVLPAGHTEVWQVLAKQYCRLGQSLETTQRTQDPLARSHSSPSGVHVRSDAHLARQVWATQVLVSSEQSASVRHPTQRPAPVSQTWVVEHSSELWQGVKGTHFRTVHSLLVGQSFVVTHSTHWAIDGSQTFPSEHCKLFWQLAGVWDFEPPHAAAPLTTATTRIKKRRGPQSWFKAIPPGKDARAFSHPRLFGVHTGSRPPARGTHMAGVIGATPTVPHKSTLSRPYRDEKEALTRSG
jgi:hypothetical protein